MAPAAFYVFDLDGTISDPVVGIGRSLNHALEYFGHALIEQSEVSQFVGPPLDQTFESIVGNASPEHIVALVSKFRERYADVGFSENVIYPCIPEVLQGLERSGIPLGLCTSKPANYADRILKLFGIRKYFRFISGGDIGVHKIDQLASLLGERTISASSTMIGDRAVDILAARANALNSVAVLWGHGSLEELTKALPNLLVKSPHELLQVGYAA